jgi:hypothetical protein
MNQYEERQALSLSDKLAPASIYPVKEINK